jgi:hypothetical protein
MLAPARVRVVPAVLIYKSALFTKLYR